MLSCSTCGAAVLEIDVHCGACGAALSSSGAHRMVGQVVLGTYEITDVLGQGGMSVVYKGRHRMTNQEVALKLLPPELAAHSQLKSRFIEEAKALAALDHPNIVHLYNFGQENGSFVLAMQYVAGQTWERLILTEQRMAWAPATRIAIDVLRALEYAHGRGVVHRDMKPSNVLVRRDDGAATVMDFGIAKMTNSTKLTATGQTMGTVRYMSPEQVRGQDVDWRTDIYSLGATLYEALVGDTPFDGETHFDIMSKHLSSLPLPPTQRGVAIPGALEDAIMRSLRKKPEERFASAREFCAALEDVAAVALGPAAANPGFMRAPTPVPLGEPTLALGAQPAVNAGNGEAGHSAAQTARAHAHAARPPKRAMSPTASAATEAAPSLPLPARAASETAATSLAQGRPARRTTTAALGALVALGALGAGGVWWWQHRQAAPATAKRLWQPSQATVVVSEGLAASGLVRAAAPTKAEAATAVAQFEDSLRSLAQVVQAQHAGRKLAGPLAVLYVVPPDALCQAVREDETSRASCEQLTANPFYLRIADRALFVSSTAVADVAARQATFDAAVVEAVCVFGDLCDPELAHGLAEVRKATPR